MYSATNANTVWRIQYCSTNTEYDYRSAPSGNHWPLIRVDNFFLLSRAAYCNASMTNSGDSGAEHTPLIVILSANMASRAPHGHENIWCAAFEPINTRIRCTMRCTPIIRRFESTATDGVVDITESTLGIENTHRTFLRCMIYCRNGVQVVPCN